MTFRMTAVALDQNATYQDQNPQNKDAWRWRSLYEAQPVLNIIDFDGNSVNLVDQNSSNFIRANGSGNYLFSEKGNYFDLYVDDNLPTNFFYGFGRGATYLPAMGGSITVVDPIPGLSWGANEPMERNMSVFTDQNGYYMVPDLEPGCIMLPFSWRMRISRNQHSARKVIITGYPKFCMFPVCLS